MSFFDQPSWGALAAKVGLFSKMWKLLVLVALKFWKVGLLAVAAGGALLKKFFGAKTAAGTASQG
jgi:uncharacterized membrane-anchored protein